MVKKTMSPSPIISSPQREKHTDAPLENFSVQEKEPIAAADDYLFGEEEDVETFGGESGGEILYRSRRRIIEVP